MFTQEIKTSIVEFSFFIKGSFVHIITKFNNHGHGSFLYASLFSITQTFTVQVLLKKVEVIEITIYIACREKVGLIITEDATYLTIHFNFLFTMFIDK